MRQRLCSIIECVSTVVCLIARPNVLNGTLDIYWRSIPEELATVVGVFVLALSLKSHMVVGFQILVDRVVSEIRVSLLPKSGWLLEVAFEVWEYPSPFPEASDDGAIGVANLEVGGNRTCREGVNVWRDPPNNVRVENGEISYIIHEVARLRS